MNALIVSLYVGYALYATFPFMGVVGGIAAPGMAAFALNVLTYVVLSAIAYFAMRRVTYERYREWWRVGILGILVLAFLLALLYHTFGLAGVFHLPPLVSSIFTVKAYFFWWFIAPLVGLLILSR